MEFPVLNELHLPEACIRLITQFAREPHPTAVLIKSLQFRRFRARYNSNLAFFCHACLRVTGAAIIKRGIFERDWLSFEYDRITGDQSIYDDDDDEPGY